MKTEFYKTAIKGNAVKIIIKVFLILILLTVTGRVGQAQTDYPHISLSDDLELIQITENAYIHVSWLNIPKYGRYPANGLVYICNDEAFLFNTPWNAGLTEVLYIWLTDTMHKQVVGFVPNHWHDDCMGGLGFLQKHGVRSFANNITIDYAKAKNLPIPDIGFDDSLTVRFGDKNIELCYLGPAHSIDNIVVWIPSEKILFPGCMVKSIVSTDLGNTADGDLDAYPKTLIRLQNKFPDAKFVIPGHGNFGGVELIEHSINLSLNR